MGIAPKDFWELTFFEFWAVYNAHFGHVEEPLTKADVDEMDRKIREAEAKRKALKHGK